jgi:hypothetical protein
MDMETEHQRLIVSEEFDKALTAGADIKSEIHGTMKQRVKNNYERFYDIMLVSRNDIQSICDKKKKDRTPEETETLKKFAKDVKRKYRLVKDMIFLSEDERQNDDGTTNTVPKKLAQLVEKISAVHAILRYIGYSMLDDELDRHGITVCSTPLETTSEVFENERIKEDVRDIFEESCKIHAEIDGAEREIRENVFTGMVPENLQFDKNTNPGGIRDSDFKKLVDVKYKMLKSESSGDEEAKEKASEKVMDEAEKKSFEIERNRTIRVGLLALGVEGEQGTDEDSAQDN